MRLLHLPNSSSWKFFGFSHGNILLLESSFSEHFPFYLLFQRMKQLCSMYPKPSAGVQKPCKHRWIAMYHWDVRTVDSLRNYKCYLNHSYNSGYLLQKNINMQQKSKKRSNRCCVNLKNRHKSKVELVKSILTDSQLHSSL